MDLRTDSVEQTCGGTRTKLLNRMEDSMLHYDYHANEGLTDTLKSKASLNVTNSAVINLDEDETECLGCSFYSGTGAVPRRACRSHNNVTNGSLEVLSEQKVCSNDQSESEGKANGSKRGDIKEDSSHVPTKMLNEEEQKEAFKSFLGTEIKRQVLDGLGEAVQDLQVVEIGDIVNSGAATNVNCEEKNENNSSKPYIVKVKLLATVCIPIFLQAAPHSSLKEQPLKQRDSTEELEKKGAKFDSLLHPMEFLMRNSSQEPPDHPKSQAETMKPQSMFEEQCKPQVLTVTGTQKKAEEQKVSQVNEYESSLCRSPWSASIDYSCDISKRKDRFDSDVGPLVVNDFEVYDFDADRSEDKFIEGQIWAMYDDKDGMPRHYAQITEVHSLHPFEVSITWLKPKTHSIEALMWVTSGISITCGAYELRKDPIKLTHVHHFSHAMKSQVGWRGEILITPSQGEVWALFKDQIPFNHISQRIGGNYELVQVIDKDAETYTLTVMPLLKIAGFRTRFVREHWPFKIAHKDFMQFSHQIPAYMLKEEPRAYLELDPASTPKLYS